MAKSKWYDFIKEHYDNGSWGIDRIKAAVKIGRITPEEYKEITGEEYVEK